MKNALLPILALTALCATAQVPAGHTVWLDKPASMQGAAAWFGGHPERYDKQHKPIDTGAYANTDPEWEQRSMPIGNGSIGANVMGSVSTERITLNEKSLWRGGPNTKGGASHYWNVNKASAHLLADIRKAFTEGDYELAARLTADNFNGTVPYEANAEQEFRFGSYTTMGELLIATGIAEEGISNYVRALSIDSAFATVNFNTADGTHHERRAFVSYPANVMAVRFSADKPKRQNLTLTYCPNPLAEGNIMPEGRDAVVYSASLDNNGMRFVVRIKAIAKGGEVSNTGGQLAVKGADEVTFLLTADTDYAPNYDPDFNDPLAYVGTDPHKTTRQWLKRAARKGYKKLWQEHYADYKALYGRVRLSLNATPNLLPTDRRLANYRNVATDHALEELYFQYGRYLLIASSRPGNLPANLQGIWHNNVDGPWRVDYHNNINLQMNYWPALPTALTECTDPLTDFINLLRKPGRATAQAYFGARGWMAGISANPFGFTAPLRDKDMSWNYNPMAAAWLATHLWERYDFTRDLKFLRHTAYPVLRECAKFTEDFLWRRPSDGKLTAAPSTSPEHGPVDEGATFTHAVAREVLQEAIVAAETLGIDEEEAQRWRKTLNDIVPYQTGRYGQLLEWSRDIDDPNDNHRHVNHLFGLHPGTTISPVNTPQLAEAARIVLNHRGDGATGWSMGWKLNQWARLHDGNRSYTLFANLLKNGTADNLWDLHPPFQIDGNFGGTAGVAEMLLQSHAGCLHLLPALPDTWASGNVEGLRARGAFGVSIKWQDGRLTEARIESHAGGVCKLLYGTERTEFPTRKGHTYTVILTPQGKLQLR